MQINVVISNYNWGDERIVYCGEISHLQLRDFRPILYLDVPGS